MKLTVKYAGIIFIVCFAFFNVFKANPVIAIAVPASGQIINSPVEIDAQPRFPSPNSNTTVTLSGYGVDLNSSDIQWSVNGVTKERGTGLKSITVAVGGVGKETVILATIKLPSGAVLSKSITINPIFIDFLWESDGYVPPFYKGLQLYGSQNTVSLVAMPYFKTKNGILLKPENLVYKWEKGSKVLNDQSGRGKQRISFTGDILSNTDSITLTVTSPEYSMTGVQIIELDPREPETIFYENDPLYGTLWNKALPYNYSMKNSEINIVAAPYLFSTSDITSNFLNFFWMLAGEEQTSLAKKRNVILRPKEGMEGSSVIKLTIENENHILQKAETSVELNYTKNSK